MDKLGQGCAMGVYDGAHLQIENYTKIREVLYRYSDWTQMFFNPFDYRHNGKTIHTTRYCQSQDT